MRRIYPTYRRAWEEGTKALRLENLHRKVGPILDWPRVKRTLLAEAADRAPRFCGYHRLREQGQM